MYTPKITNLESLLLDVIGIANQPGYEAYKTHGHQAL